MKFTDFLQNTEKINEFIKIMFPITYNDIKIDVSFLKILTLKYSDTAFSHQQFRLSLDRFGDLQITGNYVMIYTKLFFKFITDNNIEFE